MTPTYIPKPPVSSVPLAGASPQGWTCPVCGAGVAPWAREHCASRNTCDKCNGSGYVTDVKERNRSVSVSNRRCPNGCPPLVMQLRES